MGIILWLSAGFIAYEVFGIFGIVATICFFVGLVAFGAIDGLNAVFKSASKETAKPFPAEPVSPDHQSDKT